MPNRSSARTTAGTSSTPASCAACRGRTAMPATCATRNTISRRCRAWSPIAALSSARSIWTRCRSRDHLGPITTVIDEWLDRNPGGKVVVCEANRLQIQGQLEARLRQFLRRLSRRLFAPLAAGNREPLRRRQRQGHGLLSQLARQPADVHALHRQRQSLQGQAAEYGKAPGRPVGAGRRASRHGALRSRIHHALRRPRLRAPRSRRVRAGQHQRVSEPLAARQPYPGVRAARRRARPTPSGTAP